MLDYELVMILSPEATEDEVSATVGRVKDVIVDRGGGVEEQENWGLRKLAYPVSKFREGNYVMTRFSLAATAASELNRILAASEDILRFMVAKTES